MNNTVKIVIFGIFLVIAIGLTFFGFSKVKVDDFKKAAVILLVDSSASNQKNLPAEKMVIRQLCSMLDPEDNIKILRVHVVSMSYSKLLAIRVSLPLTFLQIN